MHYFKSEWAIYFICFNYNSVNLRFLAGTGHNCVAWLLQWGDNHSLVLLHVLKRIVINTSLFLVVLGRYSNLTRWF